MWSEILVFACSLSAVAVLLFYTGEAFKSVKFLLSISLLSIVLSFGSPFGLDLRETGVSEWVLITGITSVLISLAVIIRHLKPVYTRYPAAFSFTPAVIIIFYPLINDTNVLKELLNQLLQGGALVITFMLYLSLANKLRYHYLFLTGVLLLGSTYMIYWFTGDFSSENSWAWHVLLALSLVAVSFNSRAIFSELRDE